MVRLTEAYPEDVDGETVVAKGVGDSDASLTFTAPLGSYRIGQMLEVATDVS